MNKPRLTTAALSAIGVIVLLFVVFRFQVIKELFSLFISVLQPLWAGILMAYLLYPFANFLEKQCAKVKWLAKAARPISVLLTAVIVLAVVSLLFAVLIPQLWQSSVELATNLPSLLEAQSNKLQAFMQTDNEAAQVLSNVLESTENSVVTWIKTNLLTWLRTNFFNTVYNLASSVMTVGSALVSIMLAIIITIYLLLGRERYVGQCRKLFHAVSKNERFNREVHETIEQANKIFSGFISGKLLDSLIVGIICFICLSIMRMPYALLISVIVGVTNIIPMFGPFIGAIPSAFLLLLVSPKQCLIFIVFIIILQQVDGNVIGPRIIGNTTGISALYVTIAILIFGKLFGFIGMILGVPMFATIYYIVKRFTEHSLKQQGLPVETAAYGPGCEIQPVSAESFEPYESL